MGLDKNLINKINKSLLKNIKPDLTFLNVVNSKESYKKTKIKKVKKIGMTTLTLNFTKKFKGAT